VDEWPDANVVKDARQIGIPIVALCDTNNQTNRVNVVAPCNNKGKKALGLFFYLLTREFLKCKGSIKKDEEFTPTQDDFTEQ
ncbi:MAG: 30S ribosomal protein S2, partial [Candidatus Nanoarchaeia archaeon]